MTSLTESPEDYELFHYGVRGMKWGVRKRSGNPGRVGSAVNKVRTKVRERDESIKDARSRRDVTGKEYADKWFERNASAVRLVSDRNRSFSEKKNDLKTANRSYQEAKKEFLDTARIADKKTSKEIATRAAISSGSIVVGNALTLHGPIRAFNTTRDTRVKHGKTRLTEVFNSRADAMGLSANNVISLKPEESRWG